MNDHSSDTEYYTPAGKMGKSRHPSVSVIVTAYQHGAFIAECLDSILSQDFDAPFEIVIGEDGSTDDTLAICKSYADRYPDIVRLFIRDQSKKVFILGRAMGKYNLLQSLLDCRGEYIALLDGDDYWVDPNKLQRQFDLLVSRPKLSFCASNLHYLENEILTTYKPLEDAFVRSGGKPVTITSETLFVPPLVRTSTVLLRKSNLDLDLVRKQYKNMRDTFLFMILLDKGHGIIIPGYTSVYRIHRGGRWSQLSEHSQYKFVYLYMNGMRRSYLGRKPEVRDRHTEVVRKYLKASFLQKQWKDVGSIVSHHPVVSLRFFSNWMKNRFTAG